MFTDFALPASQPDPTRGVTSAPIVHCIMEDRKGQIWFATNNGAYIFDGKPLTNISVKDGLNGSALNGFFADNDGSIWFATHHNGVCRWNGKAFRRFTAEDGVHGTEVWKIYSDRAGNLRLPVEDFGVYRYDGKDFTKFQKEQGLTSNAIQCIYEDKQGRVWLGGYKGLFRLAGDRIVPVGVHGPWK